MTAEVVQQLAAGGAWPCFTRTLHDGGLTHVFVNPASVRFAEEEPTGPERGATFIQDVEVR